MHNEKSLSGTKSYYDYFIIKSNLLLAHIHKKVPLNWITTNVHWQFFAKVFPKKALRIEEVPVSGTFVSLKSVFGNSFAVVIWMCVYSFVRWLVFFFFFFFFDFSLFRLQEGWVNLKTGIYAVYASIALCTSTYSFIRSKCRLHTQSITLIRNQRRKVFAFFLVFRVFMLPC